MENRYLLWGGAGLLIIGALWYRSRQAAATSGGGIVVDPNAPTSIAQQTVPVQGVTDTSGNLLPQFTWPYNQLALPYNFDQSTSNLGNVGAFTNPQSPSFPGYSSTMVTSGTA